ncbi:MAG: hypothetical protein KAG26_09265, partial [Methylococcales bacterium]|nr:hypothetical protein [Methylococcales bacterium]
MSEDNKKYIYINKESKLSPKVESIIDGLNFIVVESYEDLPADKSEKYIILDNLTSEIPKGCKTILVTEDSKLIDSKIADAVIDSEHLSTSLGAHVFSRFLGVNSSLSLEKIFTEKLSEVGVIKITSFGDFGYYSDIIYNFAIKHNVDGVIARTYFIELGNLLENLSSNHLELLPIEIDYGVVDKQLFIQAQANDLSGLMPILSDSNFSDVTTCLKKTTLFDIYSLESNQKIVFSAIWIPGDKFGSSLLFKDRFDFDYITDLVD